VPRRSFVVTAEKKNSCKAVDYDLDKKSVRLALQSVKKEGVEKLVRIEPSFSGYVLAC
jgi:hypothetical protein